MKNIKNPPFFSVIVPVYKVENYLEECLESICKQSFKDYELILIDDGSPDRCPQICDEYAEKDSRIRVIHKENAGLVEARKTGINNANGIYTVFVDSDDWIDEGLLMKAGKILQDKKIDIIAFDYFRNSLDDETVCRYKVLPGYYMGQQKQAEVDNKMICTGTYYEFGIAPSVWSKVFRTILIRDLLMQVDGNITMGEDAAITYPAILKADTILVSNDAFYHYRDVQGSMSQKYDSRYFNQIELVIDWFDARDYKELENQLTLYKQMLFEEGILRILIQSDSLLNGLEIVKTICQQERYQKLLDMIQPETLEPKKKFLMMSLQKRDYGAIYRAYALKRLKKSIKDTFKKWEK